MNNILAKSHTVTILLYLIAFCVSAEMLTHTNQLDTQSMVRSHPLAFWLGSVGSIPLITSPQSHCELLALHTNYTVIL